MPTCCSIPCKLEIFCHLLYPKEINFSEGYNGAKERSKMISSSISKNDMSWRLIDNNLKNIPMDAPSLSLPLKAVKKIRRRTRVLNGELKEFVRVKSYSQYVILKTNIVRKMSDDGDTDDEPYNYNEISSDEESRLCALSHQTTLTIASSDRKKTLKKNSAKLNLSKRKSLKKGKTTTHNADTKNNKSCNVDNEESYNRNGIGSDKDSRLRSVPRKTTLTANDRACKKSPKKDSAKLKSSKKTSSKKGKITMRNADTKNSETCNLENTVKERGAAGARRNLTALLDNLEQTTTNEFHSSPAASQKDDDNNNNEESLLEGRRSKIDMINVQPRDSGIDDDSQDNSSVNNRESDIVTPLGDFAPSADNRDSADPDAILTNDVSTKNYENDTTEVINVANVEEVAENEEQKEEEEDEKREEEQERQEYKKCKKKRKKKEEKEKQETEREDNEEEKIEEDGGKDQETRERKEKAIEIEIMVEEEQKKEEGDEKREEEPEREEYKKCKKKRKEKIEEKEIQEIEREDNEEKKIEEDRGKDHETRERKEKAIETELMVEEEQKKEEEDEQREEEQERQEYKKCKKKRKEKIEEKEIQEIEREDNEEKKIEEDRGKDHETRERKEKAIEIELMVEEEQKKEEEDEQREEEQERQEYKKCKKKRKEKKEEKEIQETEREDNEEEKIEEDGGKDQETRERKEKAIETELMVEEEEEKKEKIKHKKRKKKREKEKMKEEQQEPEKEKKEQAKNEEEMKERKNEILEEGDHEKVQNEKITEIDENDRVEKLESRRENKEEEGQKDVSIPTAITNGRKRSQPMITHEEIVKSRYTIIRDDNELEESRETSVVNDAGNDIEEVIDSHEISPESKRISQMKRINLFCSDSDSDCSSDNHEILTCTSNNPSQLSALHPSRLIEDSSDFEESDKRIGKKALRRAQDIYSSASSLRISDSDDSQMDHHRDRKKITAISQSSAVVIEKKSIKSQIEAQEDLDSLVQEEIGTRNEIEEEESEKTEEEMFYTNEETRMAQKNSKKKVEVLAVLKKKMRTPDETKISKHASRNTSKRSYNDEDLFSYDADIETHDPDSTRSEMISDIETLSRPIKLRHYVARQELVPCNYSSTITIKDIVRNDVESDEEIWLMEIPKSMAQDRELCGKKMILEDNKMLVGDTSYNITLRNDQPVSCILRTGRKKVQYKTVNIKPTGSIVIRRKSTEKSSFPITTGVNIEMKDNIPFPKNLKSRNLFINEISAEFSSEDGDDNAAKFVDGIKKKRRKSETQKSEKSPFDNFFSKVKKRKIDYS